MADALLQDARFALRRLIRAPLFSLAIVAILALGIGANTALFSLLNAVVLRSIPVADPHRLVTVSRVNERGQVRFMPVATVAEFARHQRVFRSLSGYAGGVVFTTEANGTLASSPLELVDGRYYSVLGVGPLIGRLIDDSDAPTAAGAAQVVVLSHHFWQRQFGGDPAAVGQVLRVEGVPLTIIGVTPPEFHGLQAVVASDITVPAALLDRFAGRRTEPSRPPQASHIIGRLRDDVTLEQARAQIGALWASVQDATMPPGLTAQQQVDARALRPRVEPGGYGFSSIRTNTASTLYILTGLTTLLLLLACANAGGLLLARTAARDREIAVRMALGALRRRVVQPILLEALLLSGAGTFVALPFAWWFSAALGRMLWAGVPLTLSVTPDLRVLGASCAGALLVGTATGIMPAWMAARRLGRSGIGRAAGVAHGTTGRSSRLLLVPQIALSLALLFGAGLFARSFGKLIDIDKGFEPRGVLVARVMSQPGAYRNIDDRAYYPDLLQRLSALPGVQAVSLSRQFGYVFNDTTPPQPVAAVDGTSGPGEIGARVDAVSPSFFQTLHIPVLQGRDFAWTDDSRSRPAVVVSAELVKALFGSDNAIGRRIRVGSDPRLQDLEIIGIVDNARLGNLRIPAPTIYRSWLQAGTYARYPIVQIRTDADPALLSAPVRQAIASLGVEFVTEVRTVEERVGHALGRERLAAALASIFGALAMVLAFVGLYGLLAFAVARRTREIGLRIALGASRPSVIRMVMSDALSITVIGIVIGIPVALGGGRLAGSLLYQVGVADTMALGAAAAGLVATAIAAGLLPAIRAVRISPFDALRCE